MRGYRTDPRGSAPSQEDVRQENDPEPHRRRQMEFSVEAGRSPFPQGSRKQGDEEREDGRDAADHFRVGKAD